jgi:hypothetical protein
MNASQKVVLVMMYPGSSRYSVRGVYASKAAAIKALRGVNGAFRLLPLGFVGAS